MALNHVLIVDPDEEVRSTIRHLLSQAKVAPPLISEASSPDDALEAYQAPTDKRPNVIIFAVDLCGERGDEWLTSVRKLRTHGADIPGVSQAFATPIILLGRDDEDARIEVALAAGAYDCLQFRDLSLHRLVRTLESVLTRHEELLQIAEREARFRTVLDTAPAMLWFADETAERVYFNRGWLEFTGRTLEEEVGMGWLQSVHPDDREISLRVYREAFAQRAPFDVEYRLRRFDGTYRWVLGRGQASFHADGNFQGYAGSCIDISARKEVELDAQLHEQRLRVVLKGSPITVVAVDRDLRYTWVHNPQAGFTTEEIIGKRDDELFPAEIAKPFLDFKREVLATETPLQRELDLNWNGLSERYDTRAEPLRDSEGRVIGITLVIINVTARMRSEERAAFLAEASQLLASSLDYETTLQQITRSMVPRLADWCSVDILTENQEIEQVAVAHVDPEKVKWAKEWREHNPPSLDDPTGLPLVLRTGQSEFYPEIPQALMDEAILNAQSEEYRQVLISLDLKSIIIVPLRTREQVLGAITLVWSDSNRRYDAADLAFAEELAQHAATAVDHAQLYRESQVRAEEFRQLSESLEQQVDARTEELQRSNQDLDQFAYIASHDLKAPLRAVDHLSTWVLEDVGHLLPDRSHEHLEKMRSRIKRMEGLLDDLLTYSRAGRFRDEVVSVDLDELMIRVIDTVSPPEGFSVTVEGKMPTIKTHAVPLETVLRNLINNAIKHHNKSIGKVTVSVQEVEDAMLEFSVHDDGPGIDPAFHDRIFQMFQTLRPRDQVEGSGIGLAVVDKIVTNVGGTVDIESSPGSGATFRFTWPRERADSST